MNGFKEKQTNPSRILHRAKWVIPVSSFPIHDGGLLVLGERIEAVGPFRDLWRHKSSQCKVIDHGHAALLPALVNAHTHLEWSILKDKISLPKPDFPSWLIKLMDHRARINGEEQKLSRKLGQRLIQETATAFYADVGSPIHLEEEEFLPLDPLQRDKELFFIEIIGFNLRHLGEVFPPVALKSRIAEPSGSLALAAHACYSTSAPLIQAAKAWNNRRGLPFSIHVAEHPQEVEFIRFGTGFCRDLLVKLKRWEDNWQPPGTTPVGYLERLGVLDDRTLLVHVVHLSEEDWLTLARHRCAVCFCPRSNAYLNVGRAEISKALTLGITSSLGTDSLASNTDLDLFKECRFVLDHYPELTPEQILYLATSGGAGALGKDSLYGRLEKGRLAEVIAVDLPLNVSAANLAATVISQGSEGKWQWLKTRQES